MRLSKVVIPIEHIDEATTGHLLDDCKVLQLANKAFAEVHFIYVLGEFESDLHMQSRAVKQELIENIQLEAEHLLDQFIAVAKVEYANCTFRKAVLKGVSFTAAHKYASSVCADLLVLNTQHVKASPRRLNSFTKHLMRKSNLPIWACRKNVESKFKRIVAAIDIGSQDEVSKRLNCKILSSAAMMAEILNSPLSVVHAWRLYGESHLLHWELKSPDEIDEITRQEIMARQAIIQDLVKSEVPAMRNTKVKVINGDPKEALPAYVNENDVDLLVMGSVCRTGLPGFFIGNTAESVFDSVECDLLTLKPDEFRSPIQ